MFWELTNQNPKFYDETTGALLWYKFSDWQARVISQDYLLAMGEWNIPGHTWFWRIWYNGACGTAEETVWNVGGVYVPPTAEMWMEIVSSDAADASAWTWIRTVLVTYLDDAFTLKTETVTLNWTTPVALTATDIYRINDMRAATCWTGWAAAWNIDLRHLSDTPIYQRIWTWYTASRCMFFTVPVSKTFYLTSAVLSSGAAATWRSVRMTVQSTYDGTTWTVKSFFLPYLEVILQDNTFIRHLELPTKFIAWSDVKCSITSPDWATYASAQIKWRLE